MSSPELATGSAELLARFDAMLDDLTALDLTGFSDDELLAHLVGLEQRVRRLATVDHAGVDETDARGIGYERGCGNTVTLLTQVLGIGAGQATARVQAARRFAPRTNHDRRAGATGVSGHRGRAR
jgi:hypothetical protein